MTPGELVKAVSIALDVPAETVVQHDRNLVVAGLRTTGARGSNAPSVTHRDAARLIASILGSVKLKDSAAVVQRLEEAKATRGPEDYISLPYPRLIKLPENHSFIDGLTAIIEEVDTPQMFDDVPDFVRRFGNLWVACGTWGGNVHYLPSRKRGMKAMVAVLYQTPDPPTATPASAKDAAIFWDWSAYDGVEQERTIRGNCLMILGHCFQKGLPASREAVFQTWKTASEKAAKRRKAS
jgi:hypothetical protein